VLLEEKSGDARNDAGFVPANNSDGGELFHTGAGNSEFSPQLHELRCATRISSLTCEFPLTFPALPPLPAEARPLALSLRVGAWLRAVKD
jgi:hypothetical protein